MDFRAIFETAPGCHAVLDPKLTIVAASEAFVALSSPREELLQRSFVGMLRRASGLDAPDGLSDMLDSLSRVLDTKQKDALTLASYPLRSFAGVGEPHLRSVRIVNSPVLDDRGEVVAVVHTICPDQLEGIRHSEPALPLERAREERFRQLLDAAPDAMVVVNRNGRIDFANQRVEALFGYLPDDLIGRSIEVLIPERFRGGHAGHVQRFFGAPGCVPWVRDSSSSGGVGTVRSSRSR